MSEDRETQPDETRETAQAPIVLQLPPVAEPETSYPPPSNARSAPLMFAARANGIPDTSGPGPVMLQQPGRWSHDFDPDSGISRASLPAETPLFFNIPAAPTPPQGTSDESLATCEFVFQSQEGFVDQAVQRAREGATDGLPTQPGTIGEYRSVNLPGPGTELTSGVIAVIGQLILPAGDWDISATIVWNYVGVPPQPSCYMACALNETSQFPGFPNYGGAASVNQVPSGADMTLPLYWRVLRAQETVVMMLSYCTGFTPGRMYSYGFMQARRAR